MARRIDQLISDKPLLSNVIPETSPRKFVMALQTSSASDGEFAKVWKAWRTVHEMLQDRGYELSEEEVHMSLDEFKEKFSGPDGQADRKRMGFSARPTEAMMKLHGMIKTATEGDEAQEAPKAPGKGIGVVWVEWMPDSNVGIKHMRNFAHHLATNNFASGVLITAVHISASALKIIPAVADQARIECFLESDLLVNITHHELVPKHILLSKEEKAALLTRYRLKDTQLPRIQIGDPAARYFGLQRGQVVKIIRVSETAGRYATYRLVV